MLCLFLHTQPRRFVPRAYTLQFESFREWNTMSSNQTLERMATRCESTFFMTKAFSLRATRVLGGRRSAWSR